MKFSRLLNIFVSWFAIPLFFILISSCQLSMTEHEPGGVDSIPEPGGLVVTPQTEIRFSGIQGGPFSPTANQLTLLNNDSQPMTWAATKNQSWLVLSQSSGSLSPGETATITVSVGTAALSFSLGEFLAAIQITNSTSGIGNTSKSVTLTVSPSAVGQNVTSVTKAGITWTFDRPYSVGKFVNNDWWVVDPGTGVHVTNVSPAPAGTGNSLRHGSMINPPTGQSYDGRISTPLANEIVSFPVTLHSNQSLVSTRSIIDEEDCGPGKVLDVTGYCVMSGHGYIYQAAVLTVLSAAPPADAFRPPYPGDAKPLYQFSQVQTQLLPKLPLATRPSVSYLHSIADQFREVWLDHLSGWTGRFLHNVKGMPNYGREIGTAVSTASALLLLQYDDNDKKDLLVNFIQVGIDLYAMSLTGTSWYADGGHANGRKWPIVFAGIMLNQPSLQNVSSEFGEDDHTYFGQATSNNAGQLKRALFGKDADPAYFLNQCSGNGAKDARDPSGLVDGCEDYRNCCTSETWVGESLAARILGAQPLWNHPSFFKYVDRWMGSGSDPQVDGGGSAGPSFIEDMWTTYRPIYP